MTTECAYRSSHPDVLAWWAKINADRDAFYERCRQIEVAFPGFRAVTNDRSTGQFLVGIVGYQGEGIYKELLPPPSDAWRVVDRDFRHYVPYRNHRKDPELVDMFGGVWWKMTMPPGGMPLKLMVGARWYSPGLRDNDEHTEVWMSWGVGSGYVDPDPDLADQVSFRDATARTVDTDMWTLAKLSEFYAMQGK